MLRSLWDNSAEIITQPQSRGINILYTSHIRLICVFIIYTTQFGFLRIITANFSNCPCNSTREKMKQTFRVRQNKYCTARVRYITGTGVHCARMYYFFFFIIFTSVNIVRPSLIYNRIRFENLLSQQGLVFRKKKKK